MPIQPGPLTERLVEQVLVMYGQAEQELLEKLAKALGKGFDGEHWTEVQLAEIQRFRREAEAVLEKLMADSPTAVKDAVTKALNRGAAVATGDLAGVATALQAPVTGTPFAVVDTFAATAMAAELTGTLTNTRGAILRSVDDIYRRVIGEVTGNALLGSRTRRDAADDALRRFARAGVTGFTDTRGRRIELRSYVEMATRSSLMNAATEGHNQRLQQAGYDLVIVSDVPQECSRCRPFEGKILSLTRTGGRTQIVDGRRVTVFGSLSEAKRAGLYHPGCRHSHSLWTPSTRSFGETADPEGARAREKLRYLERCLRSAKREEAAAISTEGKRAARSRVLAYQGKIRDHVANSSAKRQRHRESITAAR